jgi:tetratricopeptide (TPR) repeat protein
MRAKMVRGSFAEADRPLAQRTGARLKRARLDAGLTQAQLAAGRYTKAYVSALENGLAKPSMAALNFFAERLQMPLERLLADAEPAWTRLEADLRLAAGDWQAAVDAYQAILDTDPTEHVRAELQLGLAEGLYRLGRGREVVRVAAEAAATFGRRGRPAQAAWATYWMASGLYDMEQGDQASSALQGILDAIANGLEVEPDLPVRVLIALAVVASRDNRPESALAYLEQARARVDELDDRKHAVFLSSLAMSYRNLGDYEAAMTTGIQALTRFRAADADREAASLENELALVYLALGNLDGARRHAQQARSYFEAHADSRWLAHVTETEGSIALASGDAATAITAASGALELADGAGDLKASIDALLLLARSQRAAGDLAGAAASLEQAAARAEQADRRAQHQQVLGEWSDVMAELGDLSRAYELSRRALDVGRG